MSLIAECFRRMTDTSCKSELRGYKITDVNRTRKFGVACRSLQELKRKACTKLNITNDLAEVNVFLLDGSLIDEDYFHTLEPQTTLILQKPGEKVLSDADLLYETLRRVNIEYITAGDKVSQFLTENLKNKIAVLNNALNKDDSKTAFSLREEHPEWFRGLETNYTSKEAYMHRRCQDRIRGYLYKTIDQIRSSDIYLNDRNARQQLLQTIAFFKMQLKEDHYFGYYFDRSRAAKDPNETEHFDEVDSSDCYDHCPCKLSHLDDSTHFRLFGNIRTIDESFNNDEVDARKITKVSVERKQDTDENEVRPEKCPFRIKLRNVEEQKAICDRKGEFRCEGVWNANECTYGARHTINPYRSREELVLFSTWNLDHKIERSRTLVPRLLNMSLQDTVNEKDIYDIYENLFTLKNLRLVHVVCHDKGSHKSEY
ncbi:DNA fragmentation factor subunit beta [Vespula pensylvanica]|uniref:DNA fragmentation factor subunit beta n=1 Tax=Vespula pensylvanica TaxID=30213 RepID=UPI001CB9E034|nr:DNA fragmentation factor subunit beta [Vespula pensylvanica]